MKNHFLFISKILIICCTFSFCCIYGQSSDSSGVNINTTDSMSLNKIISTVIQNHPSVKEGLEAVNSANDAISLAKASYYPDIDAKANYTRIGPVTSISFPGLGTFELYPANNYSTDISLYQNIFDFGRTANNIDYARESKNLAILSFDQIKQKLALTTVVYYYSLMYLQEAILINKEEQKTLQEHLEFITKKNETGSATKYEILATKVKISSIENTGIELETGLNNQMAELNALMGKTTGILLKVKKDIEIKLSEILPDSLISFALNHRNEILLSNEKSLIAELKYKVVKSQNNPSFSLYASGGAKNGYLPEMNNLKANYSAGVGLKIPLFDGFRLKYNLSIAKSVKLICSYETEFEKLNITSEVSECIENLKSSLKKNEHYVLQLKQAEEAFILAQKNYQSGSITNLDLLDAATIVSESKLLLFKSKIDYAVNAYKLKAAIGEKLY